MFTIPPKKSTGMERLGLAELGRKLFPKKPPFGQPRRGGIEMVRVLRAGGLELLGANRIQLSRPCLSREESPVSFLA